jgi:calcyphosin
VVHGPKNVPKYLQILIERFRASLQKRGSTSLVGLGRTFRIMDDSGDGQLDEYEFKKAIHDYGIEVDPKDI